jgi:hypothetical protein
MINLPENMYDLAYINCLFFDTAAKDITGEDLVRRKSHREKFRKKIINIFEDM